MQRTHIQPISLRPHSLKVQSFVYPHHPSSVYSHLLFFVWILGHLRLERQREWYFDDYLLKIIGLNLASAFPVPPFPPPAGLGVPWGIRTGFGTHDGWMDWDGGEKVVAAAAAAVVVCIRKHYQETWFECKVPLPLTHKHVWLVWCTEQGFSKVSIINGGDNGTGK